MRKFNGDEEVGCQNDAAGRKIQPFRRSRAELRCALAVCTGVRTVGGGGEVAFFLGGSEPAINRYGLSH